MSNKIESKQYRLTSLPYDPSGFCFIERLHDDKSTSVFKGNEAVEIIEELEAAYEKNIDTFDYFCSLYHYGTIKNGNPFLL